MDQQAFLVKLAVVLEVDGSLLNEDFTLNDENWDSLAHLSTLALIDEMFGVTVPVKDLTKCKSIRHLVALVRSYTMPKV